MKIRFSFLRRRRPVISGGFVVIDPSNGKEALVTGSIAEAVNKAQRLDGRVERLDRAGNRTGILVYGSVSDAQQVRDLGVHPVDSGRRA